MLLTSHTERGAGGRRNQIPGQKLLILIQICEDTQLLDNFFDLSYTVKDGEAEYATPNNKKLKQVSMLSINWMQDWQGEQLGFGVHWAGHARAKTCEF